MQDGPPASPPRRLGLPGPLSPLTRRAARRPGRWVLYHEFTLTTKQFIRTVTDVRGEWLLDQARAAAPLKRGRGESRAGNTY